MPSPSFFQEGSTPKRSDTLWKATEKILGALVGGAAGSGGILSGSAEDPNGVIFPNDLTGGALYYQEGGSGTLWQWQASTQSWV